MENRTKELVEALNRAMETKIERTEGKMLDRMSVQDDLIWGVIHEHMELIKGLRTELMELKQQVIVRG